jgi:hypothetical protein
MHANTSFVHAHVHDAVAGVVLAKRLLTCSLIIYASAYVHEVVALTQGST